MERGGRCFVRALTTSFVVGCGGSPAVAPDAGALADAAAATDAAPVDAAPAPLVVPWITGPVKLDGEWSEPDWNAVALQFIFTDHAGLQARPYSEIRMMRDDETLYLGMYAADEDIHTSDFFQVGANALTLRVNPRGDITASEPGLHAASDVDGTIDTPGDFDEEWLIEATVPIAALGVPLDPLALTASRCDVTSDGVLRCGAASATLSLAPHAP